MMQPLAVEGQELARCGECGGLWVAREVLRHLVEDQPAAFIEMARRLAGAAAVEPPADHRCPSCGQPLMLRALQVAPDAPLAACAACQKFFLTAGQTNRLGRALAKPVTPPPPVEAVPAPVISKPAEAPATSAELSPEARLAIAQLELTATAHRTHTAGCGNTGYLLLGCSFPIVGLVMGLVRAFSDDTRQRQEAGYWIGGCLLGTILSVIVTLAIPALLYMALGAVGLPQQP
jgi:hypothetical protein